MTTRRDLATLGAVAVGGALLGGLVVLRYQKDARAASATARAAIAQASSSLPAGSVPVAPAARSVALVTGCGTGTMGEGIALELAAMGVCIAAVEHPTRLGAAEEVVARIRREHPGVDCVALTADATDAAQVEASFCAAAAALGAEVNIAVATVGGGGVGPTGNLVNGGTHPDGTKRTELAHEEDWATTLRIVTVTQFSAHHCAKSAARHMLAGGRGGAIVLVGSIMAGYGAGAPLATSAFSFFCLLATYLPPSSFPLSLLLYLLSINQIRGGQQLQLHLLQVRGAQARRGDGARARAAWYPCQRAAAGARGDGGGGRQRLRGRQREARGPLEVHPARAHGRARGHGQGGGIPVLQRRGVYHRRHAQRGRRLDDGAGPAD